MLSVQYSGLAATTDSGATGGIDGDVIILHGFQQADPHRRAEMAQRAGLGNGQLLLAYCSRRMEIFLLKRLRAQRLGILPDLFHIGRGTAGHDLPQGDVGRQRRESRPG